MKVAQSDWVMDIGPGAGAAGGRVVAAGTPEQVAKAQGSRTASFLAECLKAAVPLVTAPLVAGWRDCSDFGSAASDLAPEKRTP